MRGSRVRVTQAAPFTVHQHGSQGIQNSFREESALDWVMGSWTILAVTGLLAGVAKTTPIQIPPVPVSAPSVEITNGLIRTKIYVIDAQKGFCRGQRLD